MRVLFPGVSHTLKAIGAAFAAKAKAPRAEHLSPFLHRAMKKFPAVLLLLACSVSHAQPLPRAEWGAPLVTVSQRGGPWTVAGQKNTLTLNGADLALRMQAGPVAWQMMPSAPGDLRVKVGAEEFSLRLADAQNISVAADDSGAKTGVKLTLSQWRHNDTNVDLTLYLTLALEGRQEELVFQVAADESHGAVVRQLDWPAALDARDVDYTVLNHFRGILLPRAWPEAYNPIRGDKDYGKDSSEIQSDVVECWSQAWWGFQKGPAAMMVIVETPDDAAYQWNHPAGGPTVIGPRWRAQLDRLGYARSARMVFFDRGNYVDLAKRYRQHAIETGLWVPLKEKIARSPKVASLVGTIESRVEILRNIVPESRLYKKETPEANHRMVSFDDRAKQIRELKARGIEQFNLVLTGWPRLGYDRQHPDVLPVAPSAGGVEGMKRLA